MVLQKFKFHSFHKFLFFILFALFWNLSVSFTQTTGELEIFGRLEQSGQIINNGIVRVFQNERMIQSTNTNSRGRFSFRLPLEEEFIVAFTAPGLVTKRILFDTRIENRRTRERFFDFDFVVELFPEIDGIDFSFFEEPLSTIGFIDEVNRFFFRESETSPRLRRASEIQLQVIDLIRRREGYAASLQQADGYFRNQSYQLARDAYTQALTFLPNEAYPIQKIEEIDALMASSQELENHYQNLIINADREFNTAQWALARENYVKASELKPDQAYPRQRIADIDQRLAQERQRETEYQRFVNSANVFFEEKDYQQAKSNYESALTLKPAEQHPRDRIQQINRILADAERTEREFNNLITRADSDFSGGRLEQSRETYLNALGIKPSEAYPRNRIAEIDRLIVERNERQRQLEQQRLAEERRLEAERKEQLSREEQQRMLAQQQEQQRLANEQRLREQQEAERQNQEQQRLLEQQREQQRLTEERRIEAERQEQTTREEQQRTLIQQQEQQRLAEERRLEAERQEQLRREEQQRMIAQQQEQQRLADEQRLREQQEAERQSQEQQRLLGQQREQQRLAEERRIETERQEQRRREEQQRMLAQQQEQQRQADEQRLRDQQEAERQRQEQQRLLEQQREEQRLAEERRLEAEREERIKLEEQQRVLAQQQEQQRLVETQRIARIDSLYSSVIASADRAFTSRVYARAAELYQQASEIKPQEQYPRTRLAEANRILAQSQREDDAYRSTLETAQSLFSQRQYSDSRAAYVRASEMRPNENLPKQRIAEIDRLLTAELGENVRYSNAIRDGDRFFTQRQFFASRDAYQLALSVRPNETYPTNRIIEINRIIAQSEEMAAFYAKGNMDVSNIHEMVRNNGEKRFYFVPFDQRRTGSYLMVNAENLSGRNIQLFVNYGKDNQRAGGFSVTISNQSGISDLRINISDQNRWITDDNNWISITPVGGDIDVHSIKIFFGR